MVKSKIPLSKYDINWKIPNKQPIPKNFSTNVIYSIKFTLTILLLLLLPTQFGKHFWPSFSFIQGLRIDYLSPTLYTTDILIILIFILSLSIQNIRKFLHHTKVSLVILPLILLILGGLVILKSPLFGIYEIIKMAEYLFFASYISKFLYESPMSACISLGATILYESVLSIFQYLNHGSLNNLWYFLGERSFTQSTPGIANASINGTLILRPYATFSHPNVLAGYLCITMTIVLWFTTRILSKNKVVNKNKQRKYIMFVILLLLLILGSTSLLLTLSRTAILVWFIILTILFISKSWRNFSNKKIFRFSLLLPLISILTGFFIYPQIYYRFFQLSLSDESIGQRTTLIQSSLLLIKAHPLLGVGLGNFLPSLASFPNSSPFFILQPVHNIFLLFATELGIPALLIVLYLILCLYKKNNVILSLPLLLLTEFILLGMTDHYLLTLQQGQILTAMIFGISWYNSKQVKDNHDPN